MFSVCGCVIVSECCVGVRECMCSRVCVSGCVMCGCVIVSVCVWCARESVW